ncbi:hypothetical protein SUGI_0242770 [Cryptomeria japonica]|nr:hypothetical protein SUGI_0242770 [Cryptomeria japonica]
MDGSFEDKDEVVWDMDNDLVERLNKWESLEEDVNSLKVIKQEYGEPLILSWTSSSLCEGFAQFSTGENARLQNSQAWKHNYIAVRIRFLYVEIASAFLNTVLVR